MAALDKKLGLGEAHKDRGRGSKLLETMSDAEIQARVAQGLNKITLTDWTGREAEKKKWMESGEFGSKASSDAEKEAHLGEGVKLTEDAYLNALRRAHAEGLTAPKIFVDGVQKEDIISNEEHAHTSHVGEN